MFMFLCVVLGFIALVSGMIARFNGFYWLVLALYNIFCLHQDILGTFIGAFIGFIATTIIAVAIALLSAFFAKVCAES